MIYAVEHIVSTICFITCFHRTLAAPRMAAKRLEIFPTERADCKHDKSHQNSNLLHDLTVVRCQMKWTINL